MELTYDIQEQLAWFELADTEECTAKPLKSLELTEDTPCEMIIVKVGDTWDTQA